MRFRNTAHALVRKVFLLSICADPRRIVVVFSRGEVERWRTATNCYFDRINKINRIGVGVVYIL